MQKLILTHAHFSSPLILYLVSELTQASECLRLTAARASDPTLSPSLSGPRRSVFPVIKFYFLLIKWVSFLPPTTVILAPPPPAMDSSANAHFVYPPPPSFSAMFTIPGLSSCPTLGFQPSILAASSDMDAQSLRTVPPKF